MFGEAAEANLAQSKGFLYDWRECGLKGSKRAPKVAGGNLVFSLGFCFLQLSF